jgi:hypothetical protein
MADGVGILASNDHSYCCERGNDCVVKSLVELCSCHGNYEIKRLHYFRRVVPLAGALTHQSISQFCAFVQYLL